MDIPLRRGLTGRRCRGSGGVGRDFILGSDGRSLRFSDLDGDGMRGAWIGITTGSSSTERHISPGARHFSIAEHITEGGLGLRDRANTEGLRETAEPIADLTRHAKGQGYVRERSVGMTQAEFREDSRRGARAVSEAASMAEDSGEADSTAAVVVDAGDQTLGVQAFCDRRN